MWFGLQLLGRRTVLLIRSRRQIVIIRSSFLVCWCGRFHCWSPGCYRRHKGRRWFRGGKVSWRKSDFLKQEFKLEYLPFCARNTVGR